MQAAKPHGNHLAQYYLSPVGSEQFVQSKERKTHLRKPTHHQRTQTVHIILTLFKQGLATSLVIMLASH